MEKSLLIKNAHIISPDCDLANASLLIVGNTIKQIFAAGDALPAADETVDLGNKMLMPGFIDVHTHGRSGYEFTDGVFDHLNTMCKDKLQEGVMPSLKSSEANSVPFSTSTAKETFLTGQTLLS
jgi:N-acetylglucosamine-6-phosphate deacetylase